MKVKYYIKIFIIEKLKVFTTKNLSPKEKSQGLLQEGKLSQAILRKE